MTISGTYPDPLTGHTLGASGTDTSTEAARADATSGRAAERLREVRAWLASKGTLGGTVVELREDSGLHHGKASAALTNLHRRGDIARLKEIRERCHVYVVTAAVGGRDTEPLRRNKQQTAEHIEAIMLITSIEQIASADQPPRAAIGEIRALIEEWEGE